MIVAGEVVLSETAVLSAMPYCEGMPRTVGDLALQIIGWPFQALDCCWWGEPSDAACATFVETLIGGAA